MQIYKYLIVWESVNVATFLQIWMCFIDIMSLMLFFWRRNLNVLHYHVDNEFTRLFGWLPKDRVFTGKSSQPLPVNPIVFAILVHPRHECSSLTCPFSLSYFISFIWTGAVLDCKVSQEYIWQNRACIFFFQNFKVLYCNLGHFSWSVSDSVAYACYYVQNHLKKYKDICPSTSNV